jgi:hypothetical protein
MFIAVPPENLLREVLNRRPAAPRFYSLTAQVDETTWAVEKQLPSLTIDCLNPTPAALTIPLLYCGKKRAKGVERNRRSRPLAVDRNAKFEPSASVFALIRIVNVPNSLIPFTRYYFFKAF